MSGLSIPWTYSVAGDNATITYKPGTGSEVAVVVSVKANEDLCQELTRTPSGRWSLMDAVNQPTNIEAALRSGGLRGAGETLADWLRGRSWAKEQLTQNPVTGAWTEPTGVFHYTSYDDVPNGVWNTLERSLDVSRWSEDPHMLGVALEPGGAATFFPVVLSERQQIEAGASAGGGADVAAWQSDAEAWLTYIGVAANKLDTARKGLQRLFISAYDLLKE